MLVLPAAPASVAAARTSVREMLAARGISGDAEDIAVMVTSELVTNALAHSGSERIVCRLHIAADRIRVEVEDQNRGSSLPEPRQAAPDDQGGRGLFLVEALSADWGVALTPRRSGRTVWAELTTAPDTAPADEPHPTRPIPHSAEGLLPDGPVSAP
ncbi:ATP-binding protein [Streptomyces sp. NPDC054794]